MAKTTGSSPARLTRPLDPGRLEHRDRDLRPIGKARLKALREAIRNGTYPSNELVEKGLLKMFERPARRPPDAVD